MTATRGKVTQPVRLLAYLRTHPEASSREITIACDIVNVTGRVSDLRKQGIDVQCVRRFDGKDAYIVVEEPVQMGLFR